MACPPPFALVTPRLILLPTPTAISIPPYRALYARLHGDVSFCEMAFGKHLLASDWDDDRTLKIIETRDVVRCWERRGMGDFAVALRRPEHADVHGRKLEGSQDIFIIEGDEFERIVGSKGQHLVDAQWAGYAGVRDGTTTSIPERDAHDPPLPPWQEMIEVRYGVAPEFWGKGIEQPATEAVMQWAITEKGVKRFIAETERENVRSGKVLKKLGFRESGTDYWKEPSEIEWERVVE